MGFCSCSRGVEIFCDWITPETRVHRELGHFYAENPVMSRLVATHIGFIAGVAKVFLFPVICAVGIVVMPIIALIRARQGRQDAQNWLQAWCFCVLGAGVSFAFLVAACYYIPLVATCAIFATVFASSIIIHVHLLVKEPPGAPSAETALI